MKLNLISSSLLGLALCSTNAGAVGLGEIVLHSHVGENLRAEVPLIGEADETVKASCFSLGAIPGADLPVVSGARVSLSRGNDGLRLLIVGNKPVIDPIFMIGLRASCGIDLRRDYVLMPAPPSAFDSQPTLPTASLPPPAKRAGQRRILAQEGDTLASIAETLSPDSPAGQRRALAALRRANPDLAEDSPLTEGTSVRLASPERPPAAKPRPVKVAKAAASRSEPKAPPPADQPPKAAAPTQQPPQAAVPPVERDRVILGAAPSMGQPEDKAAPQKASASEMEQRLFKMETTLNALNSEMAKLDDAIALTTEVLAARNKLQQVETLSAPSVAAAMPKPTTLEEPPAARSRQNWLELTLSALLGGTVAAGVATFLGRRREPSYPPLLPPRPPAIAPEPPARTDSNFSLAPNPSAGLSVATLGAGSPAPSGTEQENRKTARAPKESESILDLAEIMLSYGRVDGAAEVLAEHVNATAANDIQPWEMLLDLYQRSGRRQEFESLRQRMHEKFNVAVPEWNGGNPASLHGGLKALEDYAHIVERLLGNWGKQDCMDYLYHLVHDNRSGHRGGFPLEVLEEIVLLMHLLEDGYDLERPA